MFPAIDGYSSAMEPGILISKFPLKLFFVLRGEKKALGAFESSKYAEAVKNTLGTGTQMMFNKKQPGKDVPGPCLCNMEVIPALPSQCG